MITKQTFTNADLNGSYQFVYNHLKNSQDFVPALKDPDGIFVNIADLIATGDAGGSDKDNYVTVSMNNPITGTWTLYLYFDSPAETTTGRRAFELDVNNDPDTSNRIIFGKADTPSANITLANFLTWLLTNLGFLKVANNLSDLNSSAAALTNLGAYSKTEVDNALNLKATLYQAGSGATLGVANTAVFSPTANYHPATKKYVDDYFTLRSIKGNYAVGDIDGDGYQEYTVSLGTTLSSANYKVLGEIYEPTSNRPSTWGILSKTTTSFTLWIWARDATAAQNITFNWELAPL